MKIKDTIVAYMISLKGYQRYAITFLVLTSSIIGWLYLIYYPVQSLCDDMHRIVVMNQAQLNQLLDVRNKLADQEKEIAVCTNDIALCKQKDVFSSSLYDRIGFIIRELDRYGLTLHDCTISSSVTHKDAYNLQDVQLQVTGTIDQITLFLHAIKSAQLAITCSVCSLRRQDDQRYTGTCLLNCAFLDE